MRRHSQIPKYWGMCECIPKYLSIWGYGNAFPYAPVLGHLGLHSHIPIYSGIWARIPIYQSSWVYGSAFTYTQAYAQVLGHMGMHSCIPKCLVIQSSIWVYGNEFPYTPVCRVSGRSTQLASNLTIRRYCWTRCTRRPTCSKTC